MTMGHELLLSQHPELDKLTGQLLLQKAGFPVPTIFSNWEEAQQHIDGGGNILGRGRFVGNTDNLLIDTLPTESCDTEEQWINLIKKGKNVLNDPGFAVYCQQMGVVDPKQLVVDYFLQEKSLGDTRVITLDNKNNDSVFVQYRTNNLASRGVMIANCQSQQVLGYSTDGNIMVAAYKLHDEVRNYFRENGYDFPFQMEMIASKENDLDEDPDSPKYKLNHIVQIKVAGEKENSGIVLLNKQKTQNIEEFIRTTNIQYVLVESQGFLSKAGSNPAKDKPYILILDDYSMTNLPLKYNWGNIQALIIDDAKRISTFLQHDTYRLIKLVWQKGGMVILNKNEMSKIDLRNFINSVKFVYWLGMPYK